MMKNFKNILVLFFMGYILTSCVTTNDVRYLQEDENLVIDNQGLIPYNIPEYRITKNDILKLNIVTTPQGDAAQFYSTYNTSGSQQGGQQQSQMQPQSSGGGNSSFYFNGIKVNPQGEIKVFGIGLIHVEGKTLQKVSQEIQDRVNEKFLRGKSEVRLNTDGITYYILGDIESTGVTGRKVAYVNNLNLTQALAMNGGLNRTVDRKDILIIRKYPEGMKKTRIDLTREGVMNSPYYWVQNGDEIYLNTRKKNINGFGKNPLQSLSTGVSVLTTVMSIYLIVSKL